MKVIGFAGSPRKGGNSDLVLDALLAGAKGAGAETKKVYLDDLELCGCDACYVCNSSGKCHHNDDLAKLVRTLPDYDLWVLATPVYWWSPSMPAKALIDRLFSLCFGPNPKRIKDKKFALITASGNPPREAAIYIKGTMKKSILFLGMEWAGEVMVQALKKGEIANDEAALDKAFKLGKKIIKKAQKDAEEAAE